MIKHIVMWKLKEFADGANKAENAKKMNAMIMILKSKIKEVQYLEVGTNLSDSENSYDIVLYSEFKNKEDLEIYQKHSEHLKAAEFICRVRLEGKFIDYEV